MLTVWVRRTPHHTFYQGVLLGCFASFPFAFCSCLFIFCFRPLSLSFLPLSPIAYLLSPLALIFSPRGSRCVVSSVFNCCLLCLHDSFNSAFGHSTPSDNRIQFQSLTQDDKSYSMLLWFFLRTLIFRRSKIFS